MLIVSFPLTCLQTGRSSIRYARFTHPQSLFILSLDQAFLNDDLHQFAGLIRLITLECNQIELFNLVELSKFISGEIGHLNWLHVCTGNFSGSSDRPLDREVQFLKNFHASLRSAGQLQMGEPACGRFALSRIRDGLSFSFNGVQLDLQRLEFTSYQFDRPLIELCSHNLRTNRVQARPYRTVFRTDYIAVCRCLHSPENGFQLFGQLFPNVRKVTIGQDELGQLGHAITPPLLFQFFAHCRGLLELHFHNARLQTQSYDQLAQLACCQTLKSLTIDETTAFTHLIDFAFLRNLPFLRYFSTNAAPRDQMYDCLPPMQLQIQLFAFRFGLQPDQTYYRFIFRRNGWLTYWVAGQTSMTPHFVALGDLNWNDLQVYTRTMADMQAYFNDPANAHLTPHWINGDAQPQAPLQAA